MVPDRLGVKNCPGTAEAARTVVDLCGARSLESCGRTSFFLADIQYRILPGTARDHYVALLQVRPGLPGEFWERAPKLQEIWKEMQGGAGLPLEASGPNVWHA